MIEAKDWLGFGGDPSKHEIVEATWLCLAAEMWLIDRKSRPQMPKVRVDTDST